MGLILLDSTVIVGFLDADDALHEVTTARFKEIAGTYPFAASVISYAEVMTGVSLPSPRSRGRLLRRPGPGSPAG